MNAMLSDRLTLAQRKRFGVSSEKYADGYTQLNLFNEAEQEADPDVPEPDLEEVHPASYRRKKRSGKKEEDLSSFETTEVTEYKLTEYSDDIMQSFRTFSARHPEIQCGDSGRQCNPL